MVYPRNFCYVACYVTVRTNISRRVDTRCLCEGLRGVASCSEWLEWRDAFRIFDWHEALGGSEMVLEDINRLLSLSAENA